MAKPKFKPGDRVTSHYRGRWTGTVISVRLRARYSGEKGPDNWLVEAKPEVSSSGQTIKIKGTKLYHEDYFTLVKEHNHA